MIDNLKFFDNMNRKFAVVFITMFLTISKNHYSFTSYHQFYRALLFPKHQIRSVAVRHISGRCIPWPYRHLFARTLLESMRP